MGLARQNTVESAPSQAWLVRVYSLAHVIRHIQDRNLWWKRWKLGFISGRWIHSRSSFGFWALALKRSWFWALALKKIAGPVYRTYQNSIVDFNLSTKTITREMVKSNHIVRPTTAWFLLCWTCLQFQLDLLIITIQSNTKNERLYRICWPFQFEPRPLTEWLWSSHEGKFF